MKKNVQLFVLAMLCTMISDAFGQTTEIYVSDAQNFNSPPWKIMKYDENGEQPDTVTTEELGWPQDILFLEDQGIMLVSNLTTGKITKYDIDSGDFVGDFATGIGGPTRMEIGPDSLLYVLQWGGSGTVFRYDLDGTFVDEFTNEGVSQSIGIDWDANNNIYVSSWNGAEVRLFDTMGFDQGSFISSSLQGPTNIWFNDEGELIVLNWNGTTAKRFDANGVFIDDFITGLANPEGVDFFPNGNILIGDGGTSSVKLFDPDGNFIEDFIPSGSGGLVLPNAVTIRMIEAPVSTSQPEINIEFIQPTIGKVFFLSPSTNLDIKTIEVYNMTGVLIEKKILNDHQIWNATNHPRGMYTIVAQLPEGRSLVQKVVVN